MKKLLLSFMTVGMLLIALFPSVSSACSCAEVPSVEDEFARQQVVFAGKVKEVKEKSGYGKSVLFEVTNTWKGIEQSEVIITTGLGGGDCGINFIEGEEWIVYASESTMYEANSLVAIICSRTALLSNAAEDLKVLGEGKQPIENVDLSDEWNGNNKLFFWIGGAVVIVAGVALFMYAKGRKKE